ncbi:phosphate ABC transporter substrate-binding protein [Neosynechococcus sphagnicola sy1]|uniref:Phosphate ABC transporter substrate-binding protein n=1 Tax=Neosynechococcus sphagnicola sy1 TaxID=1497020 RepID=A0A098TLW1_9CYAN|nr:PstS family phosphate ABC transporter substrate-binding protein [Neosynechococcus sphagnicola]KGF72857.1 phosphate ABC transporter substrate-binding protein [Neosynechococcus sphagnicola sy1]
MSQKNETPTLILSFLITAGLLLGGFWWLNRSTGLGFGWLKNVGNPVSTASNSPASGAVAATFAEVPKVPTGLLNYGGSTTWAPIRRDVDPIIQTVLPEFRLRYTNPVTGAPGSGSGIRMLLDNQLAFSQSSRPLKATEYEEAKQRGFTLKEIPVALDGIAIAVHPNLTLSGLTLPQLRDIYLSKITNWQQVGGPDLKITPYSRRIEDGGTIEFFAENVLGKAPFGSTVEFIPTTTQALRKVAKNFGGIYYASAPEVVGQCEIKSLPLGRKPNEYIPPYQEPYIPSSECSVNRRNQLNATAFQSGDYPITRRLFVIVKQNGDIDQQAGETYANLLLTNQGQDLIEKAGFVRIR